MNRLKSRLTAAWRVYDAICNLGVADVDEDHKKLIHESRKVAWQAYKKLSDKFERESGLPSQREGR